MSGTKIGLRILALARNSGGLRVISVSIQIRLRWMLLNRNFAIVSCPVNREEKIELAETPPRWMYPFDLGDGIETPLIYEELRSVHRAREEMILPAIDRFFPDGLKGNTALDMACNEGYFSHLLYHRGAKVKGIDIRPFNIERAEIVRDICGYSDANRLRFGVGDIFNPSGWWDIRCHYDVVLFLGILYHLENPMGALRVLYSLTGTLAVIETQLTRQRAPVISGWGTVDSALAHAASFAAFLESDQETNNLSSFPGTLSFIPNDAAMRLMLATAGFSKVERLEAQPHHNRQYIEGDRAVYCALK